jgi:hypothetical protein
MTSSLLQAIRDKKQAMSAGRKERTAKIPDGRSRWKIFGTWRAEGDQFWHDFGQHFVKNAAGEMKAVYICTDKTFGRPCGICDQIFPALKSAKHNGDTALEKILKGALANGRVLVNAAQLDGKEPNKIVILELAPTAFGMLMTAMEEYIDAGQDVLNPTTGKDFTFTKEGTGLDTKYTVGVSAAFVPWKSEIKLNDLDEYVKQESSDASLRALNTVRQVAGLLPAPAAASSAAAMSTVIDEEEYAPARMPASARAAAPAPVEEVEDVTASVGASEEDEEAAAIAAAEAELAAKKAAIAAKKTAAAAPKPAAPAPAPAEAAAVESTGDPDVDDLLRMLD